MPLLLNELLAALPVERSAIRNEPGVYLLSDDDSPIYVGQSRKLRTRLASHGRSSSDHASASFAFLLARADAQEAGVLLAALSRRETEAHPPFAAMFDAAKQRVARMDVRVIEIPDPIVRSLFEMYVAEALGLEKYNSFETH